MCVYLSIYCATATDLCVNIEVRRLDTLGPHDATGRFIPLVIWGQVSCRSSECPLLTFCLASKFACSCCG